MILDDLKKLNTQPSDLRKFGLLVGGVFVLLAALLWWRDKPADVYFAGAGAFLIALGVICPRGLKWIYLGWMFLALILGHVVSTILLTLLYYLVISPIGLLARIAGKDFLSCRVTRETSTYWTPKETPNGAETSDYERQF